MKDNFSGDIVKTMNCPIGVSNYICQGRGDLFFLLPSPENGFITVYLQYGLGMQFLKVENKLYLSMRSSNKSILDMYNNLIT